MYMIVDMYTFVGRRFLGERGGGGGGGIVDV